jgi:HK97 family phage major capsid protein
MPDNAKANEKHDVWLTADQQVELSNLRIEIALAGQNEKQLKEAHIAMKNTANPIQKTKNQFENFLLGKSVVLDSGDGSELAIASMLSIGIAKLTEKSNGLLSQVSINPLASVDYSILRELTTAQVARYSQTDGTIGYTRADTVSGSIMKNKLVLSDLYHQLPVTDEAMNDVPNLVQHTISRLADKYDNQYGAELVLGDSDSGELPGVMTDLLDSENAYVEALKADDSRDANTFGAIATGAADSLGSDPIASFNALVASLPAVLRASATVTMNPTTIEAYQAVKDSTGRPLFNITPTSFQGYPLSLDDNYPELGDSDKGVVSFGHADTALAMGNVGIKLAQNPIQRDGATLFKEIGRVGLAVKDNLALRFLLAQA